MKTYLFIIALAMPTWAHATTTVQHMNYDRIIKELNSKYPSPTIPNQIIVTNNRQIISEFLKVTLKYGLVQRTSDVKMIKQNSTYLSILISPHGPTEIYYFLHEVSNFKTNKSIPLFYLSPAEQSTFLGQLSTQEKKALYLGTENFSTPNRFCRSIL